MFSNRFNKKDKKVWIIFSTVIVSGVGTLIYMVKRTADTLNNVVNSRVACRQKDAQCIFLDDEKLDNDQDYKNAPVLWTDVEQREQEESFFFLSLWWEKRKFKIRLRLIEMSQKAKTLENKIKPLAQLIEKFIYSDADYNGIAQICDPETSVLLARMKGLNNKFFIKPLNINVLPICMLNFLNLSHILCQKGINNRIYELLVFLKKHHSHICIEYFLTKAFPTHKSFRLFMYFEFAFMDIPRMADVPEQNIIPLALDTLLHHCVVKNSIREIVSAGGLQLLYDINHLYENTFEIKVLLVQILLEIANHSEYISDIFLSGWVGILAEWSNDEDQRLSSPAASALSNLEKSCEVGGGYSNIVYLLHPMHRALQKPTIDVILIHGLMGGAHSTWRQGPYTRWGDLWQIIPGIVYQPGPTGRDLFSFPEQRKVYNPPLTEEENNHDVLDCCDFEVVMADIPIKVPDEEATDEPYTIPGNDCQLNFLEDANLDSQCWPKDWLPLECPDLRVIGVNYHSSLSNWFSWCPLRPSGLLVKSKYLLESLINSGVGERPAVWITHSMGGILLKYMLVEAMKHPDDPKYKNFCKSTKAIFFFSTPHFGSPLVFFTNEAYKFIFLPSKDVEELKFNSPVLIKLHNDFKEFINTHSVEIINFVETKSTKFSSLDFELKCLPPITRDSGTGIVYEIPLSHMDICKPSTRLSFIYQKVLKTIKNIQKIRSS